MATTILREDLNDNFIWNTIEITRDDDGVTTERLTTLDNGIVVDETFTDGEVSRTEYFDNPDSGDDGIADWARIATYDTSNGTVFVALFDTDLTYFVSFEDGQRAGVAWADYDMFTYFPLPGNADPIVFEGSKDWSEISRVYDEDGDLMFRTIILDDGIRRLNTYEDNLLVSKRWSDDQDFFTLDYARVEFDAHGQVSEIDVAHDMIGGVFSAQFEDGVLRQTYAVLDYEIIIDPVFGEIPSTLEWVTKIYDEAGLLAQVDRTERDPETRDQTFTTEIFEGGILTSRTEVYFSGATSGPPMVTETFFAPDGTVTSQTVTNSDESTESFTRLDETTILTARTDAPDGGTAPWDEKRTIWEDGERTVSSTRLDTGDEVQFRFVDGEKLSRLAIDGDGSEDWLAREVIYEDGQIVDVGIYTEPGDIPDYFAPYDDFTLA